LHLLPSYLCLLPFATRCSRRRYLFKGTEDLHLDERIMQLLNVVNIILRAPSGAQGGALFARTYDVIPLGGRSGLIKWVDGTIPAFSLYKQWQRREYDAARGLAQQKAQAAAAAATGNRGGQAVTPSDAPAVKPVSPPLRPTELFYSIMTPTLRQYGVSATASRSKWPREAMLKVFRELVAATPSDLLARELWMNSNRPADWLSVTKAYVCTRGKTTTATAVARLCPAVQLCCCAAVRLCCCAAVLLCCCVQMAATIARPHVCVRRGCICACARAYILL